MSKMLILNLLPEIQFQQVGIGATKDWDSWNPPKNSLECSTGKHVPLVTADSIIIGYERGVLERFSGKHITV